VLVADDGAIEIYNLWGLRLLAQDDGQTLRVPLTDDRGQSAAICLGLQQLQQRRRGMGRKRRKVYGLINIR
jgi:hypothetical protein